MRALAIAGMVVLTALHSGTTVLPILVCFGTTQVIWPLLSVASNSLAVTLSPAHRAESVGLLNAATALGATIGGIFGGVLLRAGFVWLCAAVLIRVASRGAAGLASERSAGAGLIRCRHCVIERPQARPTPGLTGAPE